MMQGGSTKDAECRPVTDVAQTWRTQRLSFEIAGVGRVSVTADPRSAAPETVGPRADVPLTDSACGSAGSTRTQEPSASTDIGADVRRVISTERAGEDFALPGEVVLIPALGPVIPTSAPVIPTVEELEDGSILAIDAPAPEGPEPVDPEDPAEPPSAIDRGNRHHPGRSPTEPGRSRCSGTIANGCARSRSSRPSGVRE